MVKYLPISYPHQCPHRGGMSKNFCHFQGRTYSIRCQGHWNDFPEDCPLTTEKNPDNLEAEKPAHNSSSTKLLTYLDNAAESLHIGNISLAELNINEARKQLRASGA